PLRLRLRPLVLALFDELGPSFPFSAAAHDPPARLSCLRPPQHVRQSAMLAFADDTALARLVIAAAQRRARLPLRTFRSRGRGHPSPPSKGPRPPDLFAPPPTPPAVPPCPPPAVVATAPSPTAAARFELLAASPDGCTEAMMLAHGFTVPQLVEIINAGLATATAERVVAGGRTIEVTRVWITEAARRALEPGVSLLT